MIPLELLLPIDKRDSISAWEELIAQHLTRAYMVAG
jgi:hypothetical protein